MAPSTPAEWLPILAQRLDREAAQVYALRGYVDGNAPLPEGGAKAKQTWIAFQRKSLTNYGWIACTSRANRIRYRDVRVGDDDQSEASRTARRIARDNRLPMQIGDAVWDMLTARRGYLVAGAGPDGRAIITAERPELFYAEPDPLYPWRSRAAIKVWRDTVEMRDYAMVWAGGSRQAFSRDSYTDRDEKAVRLSAVGSWQPASDVDTFDGDPPVWILDRRDGRGFIESHTNVIDRLNTERLERLSTMAIQAFRQRAIKKDVNAPPLPDVNPKTGKPFDLSEVFEAAPGVFWDLPEGYEILGVLDHRHPDDAGGREARPARVRRRSRPEYRDLHARLGQPDRHRRRDHHPAGGRRLRGDDRAHPACSRSLHPHRTSR
ncbi:MAG: hypothetical protein QM804_10280 [Propionicimonas sp.]